MVFPFKNKSKNLDPSYKMDLEFWDCFGKKKKKKKNIKRIGLVIKTYNYNTALVGFSVSFGVTERFGSTWCFGFRYFMSQRLKTEKSSTSEYKFYEVTIKSKITCLIL